MHDNDSKTPPAPRPFVEWLAEQRYGMTSADLSAGLNDLVAAVQRTRKKGTLTLTITVEPATKLGDSVVIVKDKIVVKEPVPERNDSVFWIDVNNNMQRRALDEPNQTAMPVEPDKN